MMVKILLSFSIFLLGLFSLSSPVFASSPSLKINEFYAAGGTTSNPDWVEIYNDGMDLSLYQLMDAVNNKKDLATAVCNGNFCTIDWYNYLNNGGDTIKLVLKTAIDSPLDQVIYDNSGDVSIPTAGQSATRNPDMTGNWIISSLPTKGGPNNPSAPTPSPSPTPTPSPTRTSSPPPQDTPSITISGIPAQINSDQSFTVSVNITSNTAYYCKGAFKKADSSNYFGFTLVSGNWIKNSDSYTNQYLCSNSFNMEVKPDVEDSGYTGSGNYIFKVGSYDKDGKNLTWSNENTININNINTSNPSIQIDTQTIPSIKPANSVTPSNTSSTSKSNTALKNTYRIASVAAATASAIMPATTTAQVKNQRQTNPMIWIGLIFIFAGISAVGYIYFRKNAKTHI